MSFRKRSGDNNVRLTVKLVTIITTVCAWLVVPSKTAIGLGTDISVTLRGVAEKVTLTIKKALAYKF